MLSYAELAKLIDHTLVHPWAGRDEIIRLCDEAVEHHFHGVCVNGSRVELAFSRLEDTNIKVTALVGFPLGASDADVKRYEAEAAIDDGASELEYVMNIGKLKDGDTQFVLREMRDIAEAAEERPVKVILETGLLKPEEIETACALALDSGATYVCTGTGLGAPVEIELVKKLRHLVGQKFGVKVAGNISDLATAAALIEAGATRLGIVGTVALMKRS